MNSFRKFFSTRVYITFVLGYIFILGMFSPEKAMNTLEDCLIDSYDKPVDMIKGYIARRIVEGIDKDE